MRALLTRPCVPLSSRQPANVDDAGGVQARVLRPGQDSRQALYLRPVKHYDYHSTAFLPTCSEHSKPYMILVALIKGFQTHIGFAIIRATGQEWQARDFREGSTSPLVGGPERVKRRAPSSVSIAAAARCGWCRLDYRSVCSLDSAALPCVRAPR